jgi:response regulator RpfG family c-di-GMP phosphodiesterase
MKASSAVSDPATPKTKAVILLRRAKVLDQEAFERAFTVVQRSAERSEDVLVDNDFVTESKLLKTLAAIYRTNFVSAEKLSKAEIPRSTVLMLPRRVAETLCVFPVLFDSQSNVLSVVTPDPDDAAKLREVQLVSGAREVKAFVARPAAVTAAILKHHDGDQRAFKRFAPKAPVVEYQYGQFLEGDGRVVGGRETAKRTSSIREEELDFGEESGTARKPPQSDRAGVGRPGRTTTIQSKGPEFEGASDPIASSGLRVTPPTGPVEPTMRPNREPAWEETVLLPRGGQGSAARTESAAPPMRTTGAPPTSDHPAHPVLNETSLELMTVMVSLLENTRLELRGHSSQVARMVRRVAERMGLEKTETHSFILAAHVHDLGKMGAFHLTALNAGEYEGHRTAAQKAHDTPLRLLEAVRLPALVKDAVFHMYERFDGKGLPDKLVGKDIPLGSRLLAVADTYADLTQNPRNPFRAALSPSDAMAELDKHGGTIFDPGILGLFRAIVLGEDMRSKLLSDSRRALIIEPDSEESTVLELRLLEQGFDVKIARSADAARKLLVSSGKELDVVVSELDLPDADGLALLEEVRREAWGQSLPWVIHTQRQGRDEANRAFELGALDFVAKPIRADVFVAKIKAMLEQKRPKPVAAGTAKGVSGSLTEMGLPDLVQVLFHGRKTGKLTIKSNGNSGEIHFLEGAVANAMLGSLTGANAFYAMVRFQEGEFSLDPSFTPPARVVTESAEALLLEGMRRMDEGT